MLIFDFHCDTCNETKELFLKQNITPICEKCGNLMTKLITKSQFKLDGTDPAFPTEWDKWAKRHEQRAKLQS
jgi:hypothetical protein